MLSKKWLEVEARLSSDHSIFFNTKVTMLFSSCPLSLNTECIPVLYCHRRRWLGNLRGKPSQGKVDKAQSPAEKTAPLKKVSSDKKLKVLFYIHLFTICTLFYRTNKINMQGLASIKYQLK